MTDGLGYLLKSAAGLTLFYGFFWLFLRREAFPLLNRLYLLGAGVLSLVLPLVCLTSPFFTRVVAPGAPALPADPGGLAPGSASSAAGWPLFFIIYLAGAGIVFLRFLVRLASLFRIALSRGCERRRGLQVVRGGHRDAPFSFFNLVFLDEDRTPESGLDQILTHELAHARQLHSFDILFAECLSIVQWFNPFVWPYKRSLRETHEYLADRAVIAQGGSLARYQRLLVEQHVGGGLLGLASNLRTSQIKRRLTMLSRQESAGWTRLKPLWILPLAVILVLAFAGTRTVIQAGPVPGAVMAQDKVAADAKAPSDEEMMAALKEKGAKLEAMKKESAARLEGLKAKYEAAATDEDKAKIKALLEVEEKKLQEIEVKGRLLSMKKLEIAIARETDLVKKDELKKTLEQMEVGVDKPAKLAISERYKGEIKKLELAIAQETDPANKDALRKKLLELQHAAQIEAVKAAEEKAKVEKK
jgi:hypothetical protein